MKQLYGFIREGIDDIYLIFSLLSMPFILRAEEDEHGARR